MPIQSLGSRIRQARREAGLSGVALAKLIDKSQPYVSDLERGQRTPSLETLCSLSAALGRPLSFFLEETDAPARRPQRGLPAASSALEVRGSLAELVVDQLLSIPMFQHDDIPNRKQMIRIVEQAIDNAYHHLQHSLREQREKQRAGAN